MEAISGHAGRAARPFSGGPRGLRATYRRCRRALASGYDDFGGTWLLIAFGWVVSLLIPGSSWELAALLGAVAAAVLALMAVAAEYEQSLSASLQVERVVTTLDRLAALRAELSDAVATLPATDGKGRAAAAQALEAFGAAIARFREVLAPHDRFDRAARDAALTVVESVLGPVERFAAAVRLHRRRLDLPSLIPFERDCTALNACAWRVALRAVYAFDHPWSVDPETGERSFAALEKAVDDGAIVLGFTPAHAAQAA